MALYLLKRLLLFIPTLLIISLIAFFLSKMTPGDPVENMLGTVADVKGSLFALKQYEKNYAKTEAMLGLDKPLFYLSWTTMAFPDTLHKIPNELHRTNLCHLIASHGNWKKIESYYQQLKELEHYAYQIESNSDPAIEFKRSVQFLFTIHKTGEIERHLEKMEATLLKDSLLQNHSEGHFKNVKIAHQQILSEPQVHLMKIPKFIWHGFDNQYHNWISQFFRGDFGKSYIDGRPVNNKIWDAVQWTLILNFLSILLAYGLAIPLGVYVAGKKGDWFDRASMLFVLMLYSLPVFWIGTLLLLFFATPAFGMDWFNVGLPYYSEMTPFWERFWGIAWHLVLPVLCLTYPALAFISRQMRGSMLETLQQNYIRTAYAKGLKTQTVLWKHAFRNALFPIITMLAGLMPRVLAGAIVIEYIFNIPGMGKLLLEAILQDDYPVVYTIFMFGAILTMIGILLADLLYSIVDPRVNLTGLTTSK